MRRFFLKAEPIGVISQRREMWIQVFIILLLWAADKHLLTKVWSLIYSVALRLTWFLLSVYTRWNSKKQNMSHDGYHADEVFLIERDTINQQTIEYDVLRIFRQHVQKGTFSNTQSISVRDFVGLCCEEGTNFSHIKSSAHYELVVKYTFDFKQYVIVYGDFTGANNELRWPIYTENEIRARDLKSTGVIAAALLTSSAEDEEGIDIYSEIKQLAGPKENFYMDTEFHVNRAHLIHTGLKTDASPFYIKMVDFWGSDCVIRPQQDRLIMDTN